MSSSGHLELSHLTRTFGTTAAVDDLCLELSRGEFFVLLGPSGCGKTTTLRLVAGLDTPTRGDILLDGTSLRGRLPRDRGVAMVFQEHTLYPHMRIAENLGFGLRMKGLGRRAVRDRVHDMARTLGLTPHLALWPHQLSGGQAQRVALGKALMSRPALLLLDEPLSNLDLPLRRKLREEIRRLQRRYEITTIHVTHDQDEAMALGDRIGIMSAGRLLQVGTPKEIYDSPSCLFAASFLGSPPINLIPARPDPRGSCIRWDLTEGLLEVPPHVLGDVTTLPAELIAGIRPEDILVSVRAEKPSDGAGVVDLLQDMGFEYHLSVSCPGGDVRIRAPHLSAEIREGSRVFLKVRTDKLRLFHRDTGARLGPGEAP